LCVKNITLTLVKLLVLLCELFITTQPQITLRHKMCFTLLYKFCSKPFLPWYTHSNTLLISKTDLNKTCYGSTIFHKILQ
jgi:hypothetical protein